MKTNKILMGLALVASGFSFQANAFDSHPVLDLETAQKIAAGCQAEALKKGWKMSVTVVDAGANPIYFQRMDGAYIASGEIASLKAENSAKMQMPTSALEDFSFGKDKKGGPAPGLALIPGFVTLAGGLPIKTSQDFLGAVGVSGGMPNEDEACAQAGLDAVKSLLK
ncbi:heme-binding protein [Methylobacillus caricis]|uniref:GlcG/HbpS family heme-binding protein n=1 Tax=Methylobacillus caricis TaxID=1971611 RepID=UPI001CFF5D4E|nr:heme-binding protein [Methylobacillus caricis]MCB5188889.1 heme-binding protein [Methylobacillus caricis]